jgi:hypothetical protein
MKNATLRQLKVFESVARLAPVAQAFKDFLLQEGAAQLSRIIVPINSGGMRA